MSTGLQELVDETSVCLPIMANWETILYRDICGYYFEGYIYIAVGQCLMTFALYGLCCVACVIYHYFGDYWDMDAEGPPPDSLKVSTRMLRCVMLCYVTICHWSIDLKSS